MLKKIGTAIALLLFSASLAMAAVSEEKMNATNGGYTEGPTTGTEGGAGIETVYATITQGQTNWHTKEVKDFITTLNVDLNWGNSGNSLRLKIYSPDGYVFGPYFDIDDGSINGRINRYINNPNGIVKGT
ncbi:MAG: hypothetical protein OIN66_06780 [Candidatus Methanoperedens sp.]|nr:hypothetical protein [Candidatus Methanoperedens sp.]